MINDVTAFLEGLSVSPLVPSQGARSSAALDLDIAGENTAFVNDVTTATFSGTGIIVVSTALSTPTTATVRITIAADAELGLRNVTIATGEES